jgi:flagellar biosynthetic protein FliR
MIDFTAIVRFALLLVRPGALVMTALVFGGRYVPPMVKVGLTGMLALLLAPLVEVPTTFDPIGIVVLMLRELVVGLSLAFGVRMIVAAAEMAGGLIGFQAGFSVAAIVDPQSGVRNNVVSALYGTLALFTFLAVDGHHILLRALAESYQVLPLGPGGIAETIPDLVTRVIGIIFLIGTRLAAPVVVVLLMMELSLGLLARAAPALNLMVVGFPLRVMIGLLAISAAIGAAPAVVSGLIEPAMDLATQLALAFG